MALSLDERLTSLEVSLGSISLTSQSPQKDITSRINSVLISTSNLLNSQRQKQNAKSFSSSSAESDIAECRKLYRNLDPSCLMLTSTETSNNRGRISSVSSPPHVYRLQEVLARSEDLRVALERLAQMRDLLLISNPNLAKRLQVKKPEAAGVNGGVGAGGDLVGDVVVGGDGESIDRVIMEAPIFASPVFWLGTDAANAERLKSVATRVFDINQKADELAGRFDSLLDRYYTIVNLVNEKTVLVHDHLRDLEAEENL